MLKRILALVLMASMVMVQVPVGLPAFGSSINTVSAVVKVTPTDTLTETTAPVLNIEENSLREFNGAAQEFRLNLTNGEWIPDICSELTRLVPELQGTTGDFQFERLGATELSVTIPQMDYKGEEKQTLHIPMLTTAFSKNEGDVTVTINPRDSKISNSIPLVFAVNSGILEAKLQSLTVDKGTLSPAFNRSVFAYTMDVTNDVESIGFRAEPIDNAAAIVVNDDTYIPGALYGKTLQDGENIVVFSVAGAHGNTASYKVTVRRQSSCVLKSLTVSKGTLNPSFQSTVMNYNVLVDNATTDINIQATAEELAATVTVNGTSCQPGVGVSQSLSVGKNTMLVKVSDVSGSESTYRVDVYRQDPAGKYRISIASQREVDLKTDIKLDTIQLDETVLGNYKNIEAPQFTVTLPEGYHWTAAPLFSFYGGFSSISATASISGRVLTITPDYSRARDDSRGGFFMNNAVITVDKGTGESDVNLSFAGQGFNNEEVLAAVYRGNYLTNWTIYSDTSTPTFDSHINAYSGSVVGDTRRLGMNIYAEKGAGVRVNGIPRSSEYVSVALAHGNNPIVVEVTSAKGAVNTYTAMIRRWGNSVFSTTVAENTEMTVVDAPVLTVCENSTGDYSKSEEFRLILSNAQWGLNAATELENSVPDVKVGAVTYEIQFKKLSDKEMAVSLLNVVNKSGMPMLVRVPLPSKVTKGDANVTVNPLDTRFVGSTHNYARTQDAYLVKVSTEEVVKFDSNGIASLKPVVLEEREAGTFLANRRLTFGVQEDNCVFDCTDADIVVKTSDGFLGSNGEIKGSLDLEKKRIDMIIPNPTSALSEIQGSVPGKLIVSGLRLKRTVDPTVANHQLLVYGAAVSNQYCVGVATENAPVLPPVVTPPPTTGTTTSGGGGGGGGGGGSGTFTISAANETEIQQNGLYLKFPAQSYRSDFSFKTAMFSFDKPPVSEGQTLISDIWNMGMTQTGDLQKPYFIRMGYSPSKVDKSKEKLALCWLDEQKNEWVPVEDVKVDYDFGNVTGSTQRQGKFSLVATSLKGKTATLQPEAVPLSVPKTILKDIQGHWAEAAINKLIGKGAVSGNPDGTFQPEKQVTRGEFITMLVKALELKGTTEMSFSDLNGHWAAGAVKTAYASGVLTGYEDGTIRPDALITREQMALMITKAAKIPSGVPDKHPADEAQIAPWAKDAVLSAMKAGIISGYADNTFRPQAMATKAEAVSIIARCFK